MSTEFRAIRKKRTSPDATSPTPAPEGDHRKRRRNRTTQSCLNCHTSKRMVCHHETWRFTVINVSSSAIESALAAAARN